VSRRPIAGHSGRVLTSSQQTGKQTNMAAPWSFPNKCTVCFIDNLNLHAKHNSTMVTDNLHHIQKVETIYIHGVWSTTSCSSFIIIIRSGVRMCPLGTAVTTGLLYQPQTIDDGDCGATGGMKIGRRNRSTRRKFAPAPLSLLQIPHNFVYTYNIVTCTRH
jgi:hypothetical protein